jgi:peptidoglycan/xylan/chitin deacetylase (PgdA/CDA1 family)
MSIIGKSTDDFSQTIDENLDYSHVTWAQVNELIKSNLVEIQNHSYNLHTTNKRYGSNKKRGETLSEYEKALTDDVGKCQQEIIDNTGGYTPNTFTYPYGSICSDSITILKNLRLKYKYFKIIKRAVLKHCSNTAFYVIFKSIFMFLRLSLIAYLIIFI